MSDVLLTAKLLREKLGMPESTFFKYKKLGDFRKFEVKQPIGTRRYSLAKVEMFLAGESTVSFAQHRDRRTA